MERPNKHLTTRIFSCSILGSASMHIYIYIEFVVILYIFLILLFKLKSYQKHFPVLLQNYLHNFHFKCFHSIPTSECTAKLLNYTLFLDT